MSKQYFSLPKVNLSFPTANISYCVVSYKGNTTATSGNVISGNISTGTYTSRDLSFNTLYTFTLTPYSSLGLAGISKKVSVDTTPQISGTKSSVKSTYDAATLQWSGTTYDNYTVSRSVNSSSLYSDISTNIKTNYYYDNDLSGNTVYYYYVKPYDAAGNPYPNATTISIYTNVRAPADLSYTFLDSSGVSLKWVTKNSYNTSYYNAAYVVNQSGNIVTSVSGDIQTATITGLTKNTAYTCYAQTYLVAVGNTITTSTATPYVGGNILLYNVSMNSISVGWSGQYYNRVAVYRRVGTLQSYTTVSGDDYASPYVDSDISGNTTYYYYVVPKISVFEGPSSSIVSATTPVAYPTNINVIFYDSSAIQLSFTQPKNSYSTSVLYSAIASNSTSGVNTTSTGTSSPILIQNLSENTTYNCYVKVTLDNNYSSTSISYASVTLPYLYAPVTFSATGTYTTYSNENYKQIITFTSAGTITVTSSNTIGSVLIVGGGGGGCKSRNGYNAGGGGGAGAVKVGSLTFVKNQSYSITIGTGGLGGGNSGLGNSGTSSSIIGGSINEVAPGGGAGAVGDGSYSGAGQSGGSGGGSNYTAAGGAVVAGTGSLTQYGNAGGAGSGAYGGGGGGGAGSAGSSATVSNSIYTGGKGGDGYTWSVTGNTYAAGGGGGPNQAYGTGLPGIGGSSGLGGSTIPIGGVGGDGSYYGCGGSGAYGMTAGGGYSGSGYSGVVIIAFE